MSEDKSEKVPQAEEEAKSAKEKADQEHAEVKPKHKMKPYRRVIGALHLAIDRETGKRILLTDHVFYWRISRFTVNEGEKLVWGLPQLGQVAVVDTKFGRRPVVVVSVQTVTGSAAIEAADELSRVARFTTADAHTYHVVRPFKKYLKDHNIKDPRDEKKKKRAKKTIDKEND